MKGFALIVVQLYTQTPKLDEGKTRNKLNREDKTKKQLPEFTDVPVDRREKERNG